METNPALRMIKKVREVTRSATTKLKEDKDNKFVLENTYKDLGGIIEKAEAKVAELTKSNDIQSHELEAMDDATYFADEVKSKVGRRLGEIQEGIEARKNYPKISLRAVK